MTLQFAWADDRPRSNGFKRLHLLFLLSKVDEQNHYMNYQSRHRSRLPEGIDWHVSTIG